jgi:hypothetical protein
LQVAGAIETASSADGRYAPADSSQNTIAA